MSRWSCRLAPTPGASTRTSIPCSASCCAGPMPESISSCGELSAPPDRITSRLAFVGVQLAVAARIAFRALEVGDDVVPVPAGGAEVVPLVVVAPVAADVAHGVDRTAAAEHLAARPPQAAVVQVRFGRGVVV